MQYILKMAEKKKVYHRSYTEITDIDLSKYEIIRLTSPAVHKSIQPPVHRAETIFQKAKVEKA